MRFSFIAHLVRRNERSKTKIKKNNNNNNIVLYYGNGFHISSFSFFNQYYSSVGIIILLWYQVVHALYYFNFRVSEHRAQNIFDASEFWNERSQVQYQKPQQSRHHISTEKEFKKTATSLSSLNEAVHWHICLYPFMYKLCLYVRCAVSSLFNGCVYRKTFIFIIQTQKKKLFTIFIVAIIDGIVNLCISVRYALCTMLNFKVVLKTNKKSNGWFINGPR